MKQPVFLFLVSGSGGVILVSSKTALGRLEMIPQFRITVVSSETC